MQHNNKQCATVAPSSRKVWLIVGGSVLLALVLVFTMFWSVFGPAIQYSLEHPKTEVKDAKDIANLPEYVERIESKTMSDADLERLAARVAVKELDLNDNIVFTDAGLAHVAKIQRLEELFLDDTNVTDKGVKFLRSTKLTQLNLWNTQVSDAGLTYVSEIKSMTQLHLKGCSRVTDAGVAKLTRLQNLWMLNLTNCSGITDASLVSLAKCDSLTYLQVFDCPRISARGVEELRQQRPGCRVDR